MKRNLYQQAKYLLSVHNLVQLPPDQGREVAFAGRSNSGKSSVINTLTNQRGLAKTSKTPGRTQQINFFTLSDELRLVDLPGYGYAKVPAKLKRHWGNILDQYFQQRQSLMGLVLITDIRRGLTDYDARMLEWCEASGLVVHVLLNKSDKLSRNQAMQACLGIRKQFEGSKFSVQLFSALKKSGTDELRERLDAWLLTMDGTE